MRIQQNIKRELLTGVASILKWATIRSSPDFYKFDVKDLLEYAIFLEKFGLLRVERKKRQVLLKRAVSILNWSDARAKTRHFSTKELLEYSLKVHKSARARKGTSPVIDS